MRCTNDHDNRDDAAFCIECGARLTRTCPACARELPPAARFCDACGTPVAPDAVRPPAPAYAPPPHLAEKIRRERASIQGERRNVTVLFIDAVGSTAAGERTDDESYHRIVQGCTERMIDAVNRYEGTVTQFRGDGIMAVFGAPIAHEDSARRAVAAAAAMRDALREYARELAEQGAKGFAYRIGLNTGPVIVGSIGSDLTMDYTAIGDTVNLAARMEQWAPPWSIYITRATQRHVAPYFELRDLGALEVKGKGETVRAYEVLRELPQRTRLDASADRGLTAYVGREEELDLLRGYFETARRGHGQVVFVSGEPGMGKSRLTLEFRRSLGDDARWLEGRCISWGRNFPYLPIVDIVRDAFNIEEGDSDDAIAARMEGATAAWDEAACEASSPFLRDLLNIDPGAAARRLDPSERRKLTLEALRTLVMQESRRRPLVIAVEDLHWIDEPSEEALAAIVDAVASLPVLLLITYRPGYVHGLGDRSYFARIALRNLPEEASAHIVEDVLKAEYLPAELQRMIVAKAEGNPFFIEEVSRALIEGGVLRPRNGSYALARPVSEVTIPDTIQEVILSRIDRLEQRAREAVQYASVIGREFPVRLLRHIAGAEHELDALLRELKSLELIYEKAYFPELEYMFKHALTHEVALSTLLHERRRELHRVVAAAIEQLYADRLAEQYEALAYHYYQGEEWEKACHYAKIVAERADKLFAPRAVVEHITRAIEAGERCPPDCAEAPVGIEQYRMRGRAYEALGEFERARQDHQHIIELARAGGDVLSEWQAQLDLGMLWAGRDYERTGEHFTQAYDLARASGDDRLLAHTLNRVGNWHINSERPDEGLEDHEEALRIFRSLGDVRGTAESLDFLAMAYALAGDGRKAVEYGMEGVELFRQLDDRQRLAQLMGTLSWAQTTGHESLTLVVGGAVNPRFMQIAQDFHEEALRIAEEISWLPGQCFVLCQRALYSGATGRMDDAIGSAQRALRISTDIGHDQWRTFSSYVLGCIYRDISANGLSIQHLERACALGREIGSSHWIRVSSGDLVRSLVAAGDLDRAGEVLGEVFTEDLGFVMIGQRGLWLAAAEYAHARGDAERGLRYINHLGETAKNAEGRGVRAVPYLLLVRAPMLMTLGRPDEAERDLDIALALIREAPSLAIEWRVLSLLADVYASTGRAEEARTTAGQAMHIIEQIAQTIPDATLRHLFLISDRVERVRRCATTAAV